MKLAFFFKKNNEECSSIDYNGYQNILVSLLVSRLGTSTTPTKAVQMLTQKKA